MEAIDYSVQLIDKTEVVALNFPSADVLRSVAEKERRRHNLLRATRAGNLEKIKFKIRFKDNLCIKEVYTTIWATTEENIILKHGTRIPINRIYRVSIA